MTIIPNEILGPFIFSRLEMLDLLHCCQVCKEWNEPPSDERLWKEIARKGLGGIPNAPKVKNFLKTISFRYVKSNDDCIERLKAFLNRVKLDQNSIFRCILNVDKHLFEDRTPDIISVGIIGREDAGTGSFRQLLDSAHFDYKEDYYATHSIKAHSLTSPRTFDDQLLSDHALQRVNCHSGQIVNIHSPKCTVKITEPSSTLTPLEMHQFVFIQLDLSFKMRRVAEDFYAKATWDASMTRNTLSSKPVVLPVARISTDRAMYTKVSILVALVACVFYLGLAQYFNSTTPQID